MKAPWKKRSRRKVKTNKQNRRSTVSHLIFPHRVFTCNRAVFTERILQRITSTLKVIWAFVLVLTDDLTEGLNSLCKDNLDISKVLRFERTLLSRQQKKVSKRRASTL